MPPKIKPKLVKETDAQKEEEENKTAVTLSKAQLERLERIQKGEEKESATRISKVEEEEDEESSPVTAKNTRSKSGGARAARGNVEDDNEDGLLLVRRTAPPADRGAPTTFSPAGLLPEYAPRLPENTVQELIHASRTNPSHHPPNPHHGSFGQRHTFTHFPIPLATRGGPSTAASVSASTKGPTFASVEERGTEFLKAAEREVEESHVANKAFFEKIVKPHLKSSAASSEQKRAPHPDKVNTNNSNSNDNNLFWIQMPKFQTSSDADLFHRAPTTTTASNASSTDPNEIGELVVLRDGRLLLCIHNVYYDVTVSGACEHDDPSGVGSTPLTTAVASQPNPGYREEADHPETGNLVEFGVLQHKLVCTPVIRESTAPSS